MENVTDRTSNPFGMRFPCEGAVYGYGDANADFHVLGDNPHVHGGLESGVPFTGSIAGVRLQRVLHAVGIAADRYADEPDLSNCFLSYRHGCVELPTEERYLELERFVDAELRAINAHILLPVGDRATRYILAEHTTQAHRLPDEAMALHAAEVRGRGFLVIPVREPAAWRPADEVALVETLAAVLASDYRQTKGVATRVG